MSEATQHGESQKSPPAFLHEDLHPAVLAHAKRLNDQDSEVRRTAVEGLGRIPMLQKEVIPAVAALLNDQDFGVRRAAVDTLGREQSLPKEVVQAVAARLDDQTSGVRQSALETLASQENLTGEILEAVVALIQDQSPAARHDLLRTLGRGEYMPHKTLQAMALFLEDQSSEVREIVLERLGEQSSVLPDTILQAIEARLKDQDPQVQRRAALALQKKPYTTTEVDLDKLSLWVRDRLGDEWDYEGKTNPESRQSEISLDIHQMINYLHSQHAYASDENEEKVLQSLRDIIAVTGDYQDAFCCTASQYVEWQWGPVGLEILQNLSSRLSNQHSLDGKRPYVDWGWSDEDGYLFRYRVSGQSSQDVANTLRLLIWVSGAIRDAAKEGLLHRPSILYYKGSTRRFIIEWQVSQLRRLEGTPKQMGTCWNRSFRHFNVATSFPIPPRPVGFIGLEAPLRLVSDLAQIEYMLPYLDAFVLKGQRTALIPLKYNRDASQKVTAVQWHLIESPKYPLSMDTVDGFNPSNLGCFGPRADYNPVLNSEDIRHFVGLYEEASLHVGVGDCSSRGVRSVVDGRDGVTRPSEWSLGWQRTLTLSSSISIPGGSIGASTTFKPVRTITRTSDVPRDLELLVYSACKNLTLLYDIRTKTAWLVPEICAIFHLLQASIMGCRTPPNTAPMFPTSSQIHLDLAREQRHCVHFAKTLSEEHQTRLKGFIQIFRLLKEDIIYKSEGRRRLDNFFRQGNQLAGVDFEHLAGFPEMITPLNVQVDDRTGGPWVQVLEDNWKEAVRCIRQGDSGKATRLKVVSLLCDDLRGSPPIQPIPDQRRCRSWHPIPEGCDYMVTTIQCLQLLTNNYPGDRGKISPSHWWTEGDTRPFDFQACQHGSRWCNRLQRMLSKKPSGDRRKWADDFVREESERALCAIIFGSREPPATGSEGCRLMP